VIYSGEKEREVVSLKEGEVMKNDKDKNRKSGKQRDLKIDKKRQKAMERNDIFFCRNICYCYLYFSILSLRWSSLALLRGVSSR